MKYIILLFMLLSSTANAENPELLVYSGRNCMLLYKVNLLAEITRDEGMTLKQYLNKVDEQTDIGKDFRDFMKKESLFIYSLPKKSKFAKSILEQCGAKGYVTRTQV